MTTKAADCSGDCSKKLNPFIHFCMKKFTWKKLIVAAAAGFAAAMVAFPAVTEAGAKSAISIWLNSVVPVLLPFFIFADEGLRCRPDYFEYPGINDLRPLQMQWAQLLFTA